MLFDENDSDLASSGSIFNKNSGDDDVEYPDGVFHISPSIVSTFDQSKNNYTQIGQMALMFTRKNGVISLIPITQTKQMLTKIDCDSNVFWELQNSVYGSSIDYNGTRWLFLFPNVEEAEKVTSIVLFEKAKQTKTLKIGEINIPNEQNDSYIDEDQANMVFYDFTKEKITKYEPETQEKEIVMNELKTSLKNCSFLYRFKNGKICFAKPVIKSRKSQENSETTKETPKETEKENNEHKITEEEVKNEEKKEKKVRYKTDPISMKATCDGINEVQRDIERLFENLAEELNSLQVSFPNYENITMNDESILETVIKLCEESDKQQKELKESGDKIDQLIYEATAQDAAIDARSSVSSVLNELEIETTKGQILEKEYKELKEQLSSIEKETNEIENSKIEEKSQDFIKDDEIEKMEKEVKELTEKLQGLTEERKSLEDAVEILAIQNKQNNTPVVTKEEALNFQKESREKLEQMIRDLATRSDAYVSDQFKEKENLSGQEVIDIVSHSWE